MEGRTEGRKKFGTIARLSTPCSKLFNSAFDLFLHLSLRPEFPLRFYAPRSLTSPPTPFFPPFTFQPKLITEINYPRRGLLLLSILFLERRNERNEHESKRNCKISSVPLIYLFTNLKILAEDHEDHPSAVVEISPGNEAGQLFSKLGQVFASFGFYPFVKESGEGEYTFFRYL